MTFFSDDDPPPPFGPPPDAPDAPAAIGAPRSGLNLPHSLDAEREVLATVFADPRQMDVLVESLTADDFYLDRHGLVFDAMKRLNERAVAVDLIAVTQELKDHGHWDKAGGARTIGELLDRVGTTSNLGHYIEIVQEKAQIRRMIEAARAIETEGFQDVTDLSAYLDRAEQAVFGVLENNQSTNLRSMDDVVRATIDQIAAAAAAEGSVTGVPTKFRDLDKMTHGLQRGDLLIIAARPAMGKTSFALNVACNAALLPEAGGSGAKVAIFSLEMPSEQLAQRLLAAQARVDVSRLRGGYLTDDDWPRLTKAADDLSQSGIWMDDTAGATVSAIRAMCRRLKRRNGLDLVVIDYLQLMTGEKGRSREEDISHISRSLKHLAKELEIPVIALSQLNRGPESRTDKRPLMSDLRESGAIEQDADIIMFLYRDEVYNKAIEDDQRGIAEVILAKHRNGPTGTVKLKFWGAHTRFDNLALREEY